MPQSDAASRLAALPDAVTTTVTQAAHWLRYDSFEALVGVGAAIGVTLLLRGARDIVCRVLKRGQDTPVWRQVAARVIRRTRTLFLALLSADLVTNLIAPPGMLLRAIDGLFTIALVVQAAIWLRELILSLVTRRAVADGEDHSTLASAMGIIRILVNVAIWAVALILVLDNLGVNVTALVAGLGIGGIAIGLAAQGIFSDLFAALAIIFDRPFRAGDNVQFGQTIGTVEAIGLKTTRVRSISGEQVIVSNTRLLDQEIRNLRRIDERRVVALLPLATSTAPAKVAAVPGLLAEIVKGRPECRFGHAVVVAVGPGSIDVELVFHVMNAEAEAMAAARHEILVGALTALDGAGIGLADLPRPRG